MRRGVAGDAASDARRRQRRRRAWFTIHSLAGLKLYLLLSVVLISGTLAVFAREIDWLLLPAMRVAPQGERAPLGAVLDALHREHPDVGVLEGFVDTNAEHPRTAVRVLGVTFAQGLRAYWIDPYRAVVTGDTSLLSPGFVVAQLHENLFIPVFGGALVSLLSLFLVTSTVTGVVVYRRWWRGFLRRPRTRGVRVLAGDLHRLLGVWSLGFLLVIGATGLVFVWDYVLVEYAGVPERPHAEGLAELPPDRVPATGAAPARRPLDELIAGVRRAAPDLVVAGVVLPQHASAPLTVLGTTGEVLSGSYASRFDVDPYAGELLASEPLAGSGPWRRVNEAVAPLHFGHFGGLVGRTLWFVLGAASSVLALSGVLVHLRRLAARGTARPWAWWRVLLPWSGPMGAMRPLALAVLALSAYGLWLFSTQIGGIATRAHRMLPERVAGPWRASAVALAEPGLVPGGSPLAPGATSLVLVRLEAGAGALRSLHAGVRVGEGPCSRAERVEGERDYRHARLRVPAGGATSVCLAFEGWDGTTGEMDWPLDAPRGG